MAFVSSVICVVSRSILSSFFFNSFVIVDANVAALSVVACILLSCSSASSARCVSLEARFYIYSLSSSPAAASVVSVVWFVLSYRDRFALDLLAI